MSYDTASRDVKTERGLCVSAFLSNPFFAVPPPGSDSKSTEDFSIGGE